MAETARRFNLANVMLGYRTVEAALIATYGVPNKAALAFRARLTNLQKQGLYGAGKMPGRGTALDYGPDQIHRLVFACEAFELGLAPGVVLLLVKTLWKIRLREIFERAEKAVMSGPTGGDIVLYMGGVRLMTELWSNAVPNVNSCELRKLPDHIAAWMQMTPTDPVGLPPRVVVVNLSMRLRAFHDALAKANSDTLRAERRARESRVGTAEGGEQKRRKQ
jgi:hypothetical protein